MKRIWQAVCGTLISLVPALAQAPGPPPDATPAAPTAPEASGLARPAGDVVHLLNGKTLSGVQVLRSQRNEYHIEVCEGLVMRIARTQVKSIEWDDLELSDLQRMRNAAAKPKDASEIRGQRVTPNLSRSLGKDISAPAKSFTNEDLATIVAELGARAGVEVVLDPSVKALPAAQRVWSLQLPGDAPATLLSLLQERLPKDLPNIEAVLAFDKVVVATQAAAQALKKPTMTTNIATGEAAPSSP